MDRRKIVSVTGSRSDYSLMSVLFESLAKDPDFEHHLVVTGMLLNKDHEDIWQRIECDSFGRLYKVPTCGTGSQETAMAMGIAEGIKEMSLILERLKPDFLIVQGDRGEMLAATVAAVHANIAVVHLSGGDFSGSIDDSIRNAISKMAHVHLTTCRRSTQQLIDMGETSSRIFQVGEPGLDVVLKNKFLSRNEIEREFDLREDEPFILACQHSVTTEAELSGDQIEETLAALESFGITTIFTYPNNDLGSEAIVAAIEQRRSAPWVRVVKNLGSQKFLSVLKHCIALVGNSSSGIWEAPTLKVPVVNIGTRQHRRARAGNVIDVPYDRNLILSALVRIQSDSEFQDSLKNVQSPYGDGQTTSKILKILKALPKSRSFVAKWMDHN